MSNASDRDHRLKVWLEERLGLPEGALALTGIVTPEGVGHSNETVLFDAEHDGVSEPFVLRVQPADVGVFPVWDLGLQVECMTRVGALTKAAVPVVRWYEPDESVIGAPFFVMDRIDGLVPRDRMPYTMDGWLYEAAPEDQRRLILSSLDAMAEVHRADWRSLGLDGVDRTEYGPAGMEQQLGWWEAYATWAGEGRPQPTIDLATAWLRENFPTEVPPTVLNWGDARISNIIYVDFEPAALLDWEMATLGPPEVDLAWFLFFNRFFSEGLGIPDLAGFPSPAESVDHYAALLGRDIADLFWYEVFAAWRHSNVMLRLARMYEAAGDFPAGTDAGQNNIATRMLANLLDLPIPGPPGGPMG